jgi:hypothetical protein
MCTSLDFTRDNALCLQPGHRDIHKVVLMRTQLYYHAVVGEQLFSLHSLFRGVMCSAYDATAPTLRVVSRRFVHVTPKQPADVCR